MQITVITFERSGITNIHVFYGWLDLEAEDTARKFLLREDEWDDNPEEPESWLDCAKQLPHGQDFDNFRSTYAGDFLVADYIKTRMMLDKVEIFHYTMDWVGKEN